MDNKENITILDVDDLIRLYKHEFRVIQRLSDYYTIKEWIDPDVKLIGKLDSKGNLSLQLTYTGFSACLKEK